MWHLAGMSLWVCYIINAVVHLLVLWLCEEARLSLTAAGLYSSLTFATSLVGKVGFGAALDRPDRHRHALASCALLTAGPAAGKTWRCSARSSSTRLTAEWCRS